VQSALVVEIDNVIADVSARLFEVGVCLAPRIDIQSCQCAACGGNLHPIGEEISEKLDLEPVRFFVRKIIRPKYACRACDTLVTPPMLPAIIERSIASPGLLAHVLVSKYADHLPLYRQSQMLARSSVTLSVSTLAGWVGACGFALQPLVDAMRLQLNPDFPLADAMIAPSNGSSGLKKSQVIHADETPVKMLDPGRGKTKTTYLFAYRRGDIGEPPLFVFDFATSRSGAHAREFLSDYGEALVVDDYSGYKHLFAQTKMRELACWAHARRKFFDLHTANKSAIAADALRRIAAIYAIEEQAKNMTADARKAHRWQHAAPLIENLCNWLESIRPNISSGSATVNAIDYLLRRKIAFTRYLENGLYPIDNNPVENAIRPIAIGRKNWLFTGSANAGARAANIMSLIQTAKANGHDPLAYLRDVFERLPTQLNSKIDELLPHTWQPPTL
jgi:transposase